MTTLSFISMYMLMYIMVNIFANVYPNLNQLYMAGVMAIPMLLIELFLMRSMYNNKKVNTFIVISSLVIFILLIIFIRRQTSITDKEFLKSMIPHHAAAILMCEKAQLENPEIKELCKNIISAQQSEIDLMKEKLKTIN
ncbi:MAG TPA: DUF305 domain-containing protein [Puia sp.]|nr:DUF305 domain-containing protein [Puia sp.]